MTISSHRSFGGRVAAAGVVLMSARGAYAQSAEDQATARALFNEAKPLMEAGHYDAACPKLEAASKVYPGSGVLLNLGDCYEHEGRTASAWTEFGEAASAAERFGRADDLAEARRRQSALEPRLSRLAIRVAHDVPGLVISRDGSEIDRGAWSEAIPIDPGVHAVTARAPGREDWSGSVTVADAGRMATVVVPELAPIAPPSKEAVAAPPAVEPPYWTGRRIASASVAGVGVGALVASGVLVGIAKAKDDSARAEGGTAGYTDSQSAADLGTVATVIGGIGAALAVGGAIFWLTAPSDSVQVGSNGCGVLLRGSF
ncbi:MAG TPA: hypothetical protein VF765_23530 [Polyangiaceae bacterium]